MIGPANFKPAIGWRHVLVVAFVYLFAFPYFDALRSANEVPRVLTTEEIVDHGRFWLDARLGEMGSRNDLSSSPDGHKYANKPPGPSLLAIPAYLVCKVLGGNSLRACTWAFRFSAVMLPALVFLYFFASLLRRFAPEPSAQRALFVAYAFGSPAFVYSLLFMSHQPSAVCAGGAFIASVTLVRGQPIHPLRTAFVGGFLAAMALMMDYQAFIAVALMGLYLLVGAWRRWRVLIWAVIGTVPPTAVLLLYHWSAFGSALKTGYHFADDPNPTRGLGGMIGLSWSSFWNISFLPANGLFVLAPWTLLAMVGCVYLLAERERRKRLGLEAVLCIGIFVGYLLFMSSLNGYMSRGGWCVGPRYLTTSLPFVACLAGAGFMACERFLVTRILAQASIVVGIIIFVVAGTTYPHWPDPLGNPLYELSFRLLREGYAVHSLGTIVGLSGIWAILPLYLVVAGIVLRAFLLGSSRPCWTVLVACVLASSVVFSYQYFQGDKVYAERAYRYVTATWEPQK